MSKDADQIDGWRGIALILAALALGLRLLVPAGYMVSSGHDGYPLVICQGQSLAGHHGDGGSEPSRGTASHEAPCAFSGGVAVPPPAPIGAALAQVFVTTTVAPAPAVNLTPGRGLAAPPPPARGPPILLA